MKPEVHPNYNEISVVCACGSTFQTRSTLKDDLHIEICSACHPFFTGKQKLVDTGGRVDRFKRRFNGVTKPRTLLDTDGSHKPDYYGRLLIQSAFDSSAQ